MTSTAQRFLRVFGLASLIIAPILATPAHAQYFGQNKVQYDQFEFKILKTAHFDIYYYPSEADAARQVSRMAERWHARLSRLIGYELMGRQPVVLYASHPEFEQTNVIEGAIGEGTGGVTESARRRVVLPLAATLGETDHVLGHELVHAFQYDILGRNAEGAPLWFIEGMAEYLSLGPRSPQTSMWVRDAVLQDRVPAIKDLDNPRYFPYRFGQAFWAYIGGKYGDRTIGSILRSLAGDENGAYRALTPVTAIEQATGQKQDELSKAWHQSISATYGLEALPKDQRQRATSDELVIGERTGSGTLNVGPSLSPDGKQIAFLSTRNRLAVDLYIADVESRQILRKLTSNASDPHFESLQFLASAGTWDPAGKRLAVAAVRSGKAELAIFDVDSGKIVQEIPFEPRGEIFQPHWSPDGQSIVFSAQVGGFTDLYVYEFGAARTRQLTKDAFADLEPVWSPDGKRIAFVSDRQKGNLTTLAFGGYGISVIEPESGAITAIETGLTGNAFNPQWSRDGNGLYYIGDTNGRLDVYRVDLSSKQSVRIAEEVTGITGITDLSTALSVAPNGRAAYSLFRDGGYEIRLLDMSVRRGTAVDASAGQRDLGLLPPVDRVPSLVVAELQNATADLPPATAPTEEKYSPRLSLVNVGQMYGGGISTGAFGTFLSGGVSLLFADMLNNHMLMTGFDVNGDIGGGGTGTDVAFQVAYLNRVHRWNWSVYTDRVPLLSGSVQAGTTIVNGQQVYVEATDLYRQTATEVGGILSYPLSRATRVEFGTSVQHVGFDHRQQLQYFDPFSGSLLAEQTTKLDSPASVSLYGLSTALVRDTSAFGAVGPILGQRLRLEATPTVGDLKMTVVSTDLRQYVMPFQPLTLAGRALHVGRYGGSSEDERLTPLFLGYPSLVRGYDVGSFDGSECVANATSTCPQFDRLLGSRIAVFNGEARVPLVGLFTGKLDYGPVPVELFGFFDSGVAWTRSEGPSFSGGAHSFVSSAGAGARVNVFGFAVAEFNMAKPLNRAGAGWHFVFNLGPSF